MGNHHKCHDEAFGDPDHGAQKFCRRYITKNHPFNEGFRTLVTTEHKSFNTTAFSKNYPIWIGYGNRN